MSANRKILYITYDGMTDPLGQSQILPYLTNLSRQGYRFTILSCEKRERYKKYNSIIREITVAYNIEWEPLWFSTKPPVLSKFFDALKMRRKALQLQRRKKFDMVHCRSYIAADIGWMLKKRYGIKFLFDMRGFWADEKKDAGSWPQDKFLYRKVYNYYKKKEAGFLQHADHIISLTNAGKKEMLSWNAYNSNIPLTVIPCCADMNHFSVTDIFQKNKSRVLLKINKDRFVVSYLGSVGAWYMLDEMLEMFRYIKKKFPQALFLFITHSSPDQIKSAAARKDISLSDLLIVEATREEVPLFAKASDISVSFIKPVYSKISSSPTKLGELLSMGIPVISNDRVGDVEEVICKSGGGLVIRNFTTEEYEKVTDKIPELLKKDPAEIRNNIRSVFSLDTGTELYSKVYEQIFANN